MSPETLERFRKRFHKIYDHEEAEGLAQAGCTMVGEVERLEAALEASRETARVARDDARTLEECLDEARGERDDARHALLVACGFKAGNLREANGLAASLAAPPGEPARRRKCECEHLDTDHPPGQGCVARIDIGDGGIGPQCGCPAFHGELDR